MTDWSMGYSAGWRVFRVDPVTWADAEPVGGITAARVERDGTGDSPALERGTLALDLGSGEVEPGYYRLALTATQGDASERVDVATLLCEATRYGHDHGSPTAEVTGRSVLHPASVSRLVTGSYAPAGVDGAGWAAEVLRGAINAPIEVAPGAGFTLDHHVVLDPGTSALEAAWLVLRAGRHILRIDGRGRVLVAPRPSEPSLVLDRAGARLLHPGVTRSLDLSAVPNRYVAVDGGEVAEAVNDDPASSTSTVSRGWRSDTIDTSPVRVDGETLSAYARRRLEEESTVPDAREYSREFWPEVLPFDIVLGSISSVGLDGYMRVERQSLTCGRGVVVEERASREVSAWHRN